MPVIQVSESEQAKYKPHNLEVKRVLLLNPPGDQIYIRDYYHSKISKTTYVYHPVDLLVMSGMLHEHFGLEAIDAIVDKLSFDECFDQIMAMDIDAIVFQTGSVSFKSDMRFLKEVKLAKKMRGKEILLVGSGDIFLDEAHKRLAEQPHIDGILPDFSTWDVVEYLKGNEPNKMVYRVGENIIQGEVKRERGLNYEFPRPRHELFMDKPYIYPFIRRYPFATVLTDYGCPYKCSFCITSKIGFKTRTLDSVKDELQFLKKSGIKDMYIDDQTFGVNKKRTQELCEYMIEQKFDFGWVCFSRVDVVTEDSIALWKKAGCHTIMFGVESANQWILDKYGKGITLPQIRKAVGWAQAQGIRVLGTFIIGLPGETKTEIENTIHFAKEIGLDFASFNIPVPRVGTDLRKDSIAEGLIPEDLTEMDQSGKFMVMETKQLSGEELKAMQKKAYRSFYLRPSYIAKRLLDIKTMDEFKVHCKDAISIVQNLVSKTSFRHREG